MSNGQNTGETAVIVLLVVFLLIPFALIVLSFPAQSYYVVTGETVREAAEAAGVQVNNVTDVVWPLPGAQGGKTYTLEDNAGHVLIIQTQKFESEQSRDSAVRTYYAYSFGKGRPSGFLVVRGQELIYVMPDQGGLLNRLGPEIVRRTAQ
jgi:hypothetical protein